jgi:hypothetical protein
LTEEWYQEGLSDAPWFCLDPSCPVTVLGLDEDPLDGPDGTYLCPKCHGRIYRRCGSVLVPAEEIVEPEVCAQRCYLFVSCVRYRLQRLWQAEAALLAEWLAEALSGTSAPGEWDEAHSPAPSPEHPA